MAVDVRFEVWTRPESGTFVRKFPLRNVVDWSLQLGMFGRGSISLPSDDTHLDDIIYIDLNDRTNDAASIIRAFIGDTWLYDFYAVESATMIGDTGQRTTQITGGGIGTALDRSFVHFQDYDVNPTVQPDWVWGPTNSLLKNPGFEDGLPDEDFEDLNLGGWSELGGTTLDAGESNATWEELLWDISASPSSPITGAYSLQIPFPGTPPAGVSKTISVIPGATVRVQYNFEEPTANGDRFLMFAADPDAGTIPTILSTNGWIYNGVAFVELDGAVRGAGASDGTTQTFDIEVTCGAHQTRLQIGCQNATTSTGTNPGYLDDGVYTGDGLGLSPWFAHREVDYQIMELDSTVKRTGSSSLKFQTTSMADDEARDGPTQYVFCEVGKQYDLGAWIYQTSGLTHYFRVGMKRRGSGWTAGLTEVAVPTATWTRVSCNGVADQEAYEYTIRWVNATGGPSASPVFWVDDCWMGEGKPESTYGAIMGELLDDAGTNHAPDRTALAWLTRTFTDTKDSTVTDDWIGNVSVSLSRGQSLRRVVSLIEDKFGYEIDMHPNATDYTDIELDLFNVDSMGTDYTTTDGGAITGSGLVAVGPIIRREPLATYAVVEGDEQEWGESRNTDMEVAWGEIELYQGVDEITGTLNEVAARLTTGSESEIVVVKFQNPNLIPGIDYKIGDVKKLTLGSDILPTTTCRVIAIDVSSGDPEPVFQVQLATEGGT